MSISDINPLSWPACPEVKLELDRAGPQQPGSWQAGRAEFSAKAAEPKTNNTAKPPVFAQIFTPSS
ncbi:MAG: hypothetical protein WBE88_12995 [Candidatus Acidiferrales bacterium]